MFNAFFGIFVYYRSDKIAFMIDVAKERDLKIDFKEKAYIDKLVGSRPHQVAAFCSLCNI